MFFGEEGEKAKWMETNCVNFSRIHQRRRPDPEATRLDSVAVLTGGLLAQHAKADKEASS